ncbi:hypothetical protein [Bacillus toyonensis]|uniref:hypothetical protein n=1 Tax=Bacillus toyonensis TaxID=155322 RepID=UPI002E238E9E|nr:hypothetical protein [Bacillus toyonensis]
MNYYFKELTKEAQNLAIKKLYKEMLLKMEKWEQLSTQINIKLQKYLETNGITMIEELHNKHYQYYLNIHTVNDIRLKATQVYIDLEKHLKGQEKSNYLLLKKYSSYYIPDIFLGYGGQNGVEDLDFGSEHFNTNKSNKNEIYLEFLREANIDIGIYEVVSYFNNNDNEIELRVNQVCDQLEKGIREQIIALVNKIETGIIEIVMNELNNEKYIKLVYSMLLKDTYYVFDELGHTIN